MQYLNICAVAGNHICIEAFVDNDSMKQGQYIEGVRIVDARENEIYESYIENYYFIKNSYNIMSALLDKKNLQEKILANKLKDIYIYGSGYLGVQFYDAVVDYINPIAFVDQSESIVVEREKMRVISMKELKLEYAGQVIVITPFGYHDAIVNGLSDFVDASHILSICDFTER